MICKYTCTLGRPQGEGKSRRPPPKKKKYISMWGPFFSLLWAFSSMWWHIFSYCEIFLPCEGPFSPGGGGGGGGLSLLTKNSKDANACTCMS